MASIVVFSHGFAPHVKFWFGEQSFTQSWLGKIIWVVNSNLFNGAAAVMVFFIVSGFCIHYPYASGKTLKPGAFLASRYLRICLPLGLVLLIAYVIFDVPALAYAGVWSLVCELIYYSIYPLLLKARRVMGSWRTIFLICLLGPVSILMLAKPEGSHSGALMDFAVYGHGLTWLLALPIWIAGCHLADSIVRASNITVSLKILWLSRLGLLVLMLVFSFTKYHGDKILGFDTPNTLTLQVFSIFAYFWLSLEIHWYLTKPAPPILEYCGKFSYSLYIVHPLMIYSMPFLFTQFAFINASKESGLFIAVCTLAILALSYLYFLLVEKPSHRLAKSIASKF